jgi:hypothetical protein
MWVLLSLLLVGILNVINNYVGAEVSFSLSCLILIFTRHVAHWPADGREMKL